MLKIVEYDKNKSYRVLLHGMNVFHAVQEGIWDGETYFHVEGEDGKLKYDLEYIDNQAWARKSPDYSTAKLFRTYCSFPPYHNYDENSKRLCFTLLEGKDRVWIEEANEYTVVLAGIVLRETDLRIFCKDERLLWFYPASDRLTVDENMPTKDEPGLLRVISQYFSSMFNKNYDLQEYAETVLEGKKMLGVLLRGSDFFKANFEGGAAAIPYFYGVYLVSRPSPPWRGWPLLGQAFNGTVPLPRALAAEPGGG